METNFQGVDEFIGCIIRADCSTQGIYEGRVLSVNPDPTATSITIENPHRNGSPLQESTFEISSEILRDIKVIRMPSSVSSAADVPKKSSQPYALFPDTPVSSKKKYSMPGPMILSPATTKESEKKDRNKKVSKIQKPAGKGKENTTMGRKINASGTESLIGKSTSSKEKILLRPRAIAIAGISGDGKQQPVTDQSNSANRKLSECCPISSDKTKSSGQANTKRDNPHPPIISASSKGSNKWCQKSKSPQSNNEKTKKSSPARPESKAKQIDVKKLVKSFAEPITIESDVKRLPNLKEEIDDPVGQVSYAEYIGCLITIDFGADDNIQGRILNVDPENCFISLQTPFQNGRPMPKPIEIVSKEMLRSAKQLRVFKPLDDAFPNDAKDSQETETFSTVQQPVVKKKSAEGSKRSKFSSIALNKGRNNSTSTTKSGTDIDTGGSETDDEQSSPQQTHIVKHGRDRNELNQMSAGVAKLFASIGLAGNNGSKTNTNTAPPAPTEAQSNSINSKSCKAAATVAARLYTDYGDFRLFNEKQMPAPTLQRLALVKPSQNQQQQRIGPSGIPTIDCTNGYGRFVSPGNRGLASIPIDDELLNTDFDFDGNLALFNKDEFDRDFDRCLDAECD